jgi:hypothetical protein
MRYCRIVRYAIAAAMAVWFIGLSSSAQVSAAGSIDVLQGEGINPLYEFGMAVGASGGNNKFIAADFDGDGDKDMLNVNHGGAPALYRQSGSPHTVTGLQPYPVRSGSVPSSSYTLSVNGENLFVEKFGDISFARFIFTGTANITVTANETVSSFGISPQSYQIQGSSSGNDISFSIDQPRTLIVNINNLEKLFIFADGPETAAPNPDDPNVIDLADYLSAGRDEEAAVTSYLQNAIDDTSALNNGAGGTLFVPDGKYMTAQLKLKSNVHLYLQSGAWIKAVPDSGTANYPVQNGSDSSFLFIQNASHVKISGRGIIDGSGMAMKTLNGSENIKLLRTADVTDLQIEDVYFIDSARWTIHLLYAKDVVLKHIKLINDLRGGPDPANPNILLPTVTNTDGIDIDSSQNVTIDGAFIYTGDDAISPKVTGYLNLKRPTTGLQIKNNVFWSLKAALKVGDETQMDIGDIRFENNDIVHADRFLALWAGDASHIQNIDVINNRAEFIGGNYNERYFYFRIRLLNGSSKPGWIDQVYVKDFYVLNKAAQASSIEGYNSAHQVSNVTFENIVIQGAQAESRTDVPLDFKNTYYSNVVFQPSGTVYSGMQPPSPQYLVEAEDMTLVGYTPEVQSAASGGKVIKVSGTGTAAMPFNGQDGAYDLKVHYFDENDGAAAYRLFVNDQQIDAWTADQDLGSASVSDKSRTSRRISGILLSNGDIVKLEGTSNDSEAARVDRLEFIPITETDPPAPGPRVLLVDRRGMTSGAYPSIAAAVASSPALQPGDVISLVPGSGPYHETVKIRASGVPGNPIIFEGNGELISGFTPFQFTQEANGQWTYVLPDPIANTLPGGKTSTFWHLVAYNGQRLLLDQPSGQNAGIFTSDNAGLSADGAKLILNPDKASPTSGWEISTLTNGVEIVTPDSYQTYRNLRVTGVLNDGFNIHGTGTGLVFENIEAFNNFDEGFSSHDLTNTTIEGGRFWGNENGIYNQSRDTITFTANNVKVYSNIGYGVATQMGTVSLSNVEVWDNGISNLRVGGRVFTSNVVTYESRWSQRPWVGYQESQNYKYNQEVKPYAYSEYVKADYPITRTGTAPTVLPASQLPPFKGAFDDWRHIYFSAAELSNSAISGPDADPDEDGLDNFGEYTAGHHPKVSDNPASSASANYAVIRGQASVQAGQPLDLILSNLNVTSNVYAEQLTVQYNPMQLQYMGTDPRLTGLTIVSSTYGDGRITIIAAGLERPLPLTGSADLFTLRFQSKESSQTVSSSVYIASAAVSDQSGHESNLHAGPAYEVQIIVQVADKSVLSAKLTEAVIAVDAAQISDRLYGHYPQAAVQALNEAIAAAKVAADDERAKQTSVDLATGALSAALQTYLGTVNTRMRIGDLGVMAGRYGETAEGNGHWNEIAMYDFNQNGVLDLDDLSYLANEVTD